MLDPFREQNPKKKVWSFFGTGAAGNSRIDRVYVNSEHVNSTTKIRYFRTPFHGHKVLTFTLDELTDKGKSYFKLNTSVILWLYFSFLSYLWLGFWILTHIYLTLKTQAGQLTKIIAKIEQTKSQPRLRFKTNNPVCSTWNWNCINTRLSKFNVFLGF